MIKFLSRIEERREGAELRAGGTDLMDRVKRGVVRSEVDDLRDVPELDGIVSGRIGAKVTLARLAADASLQAGWPALTKSAGALATPQIRSVATLGGNLAQKVRCSWYRDPAFSCHLNGGFGCPAKDGDRQLFAVEDGGCIAVHPSTVATALLLYDAGVEVDGQLRTFPEWLQRPTGTITHVVLPAPEAGEVGAYHRATHRARAEWPLVEVAGRRVGAVVSLAAGGVAHNPVRLSAVEAAVAAGEAEPWRRAGEGWKAHADTAFKLPLLQNLTRVILEMLS
jgi:xanthine dehydrogenase YagS FAD-binding subunit